DQCALANQGAINNDYDGFTTGSTRFTNTGPHDVIASVSYQVGPLGNYYQLTSSGFVNKGSTTADVVGLYHFTVFTNLVGSVEIKETNSPVDIGVHYVATDANGNPGDKDLDMLADYLEDSDGGGTYNTGDLSNWQVADTDGDGVSDYLEWIQGRNP